MLLWLLLAVAGLGAWLWATPRIDPDASLTPWPDEVALVEAAREVVADVGFAPAEDAFVGRVYALREDAAVDSLQTRLGRTAAVKHAQATSMRLWRVRWIPSASHPEGPQATPVVWFDDGGRLAGLSLPAISPDSLDADGGAVRRALSGDGPTLLTLPPDSALKARRFALDPLPGAASVPAPGATSIVADTATTWTAEQAGRMALAHLDRSAYRLRTFAVDSVRASTRPGVSAALVYLHTRDDEVPARWARVEVGPGGALLGLDVHAWPGPVAPQQVRSQQVRGYGSFALMVIVALSLVVAFLRRLAARQMDVRGSVRDGLLGALLFGAWMFLTSSLAILDSTPTLLSGVFAISINVLLVSIVGGVVVTTASGVAEVLSRPRFPEAFTALALLRRGSLHDVRVSRAFLRGTSVGLAFLGGLALLLLLLPQAAFVRPDENAFFLHSVVVSPAGAHTAQALLLAFFAVLGGAFPLLARAHDQERGRWGLYAGAVVVVAMLAVPFTDVSDPYGILFALMLGAVVVWMMLRYDALTAITALTVVVLLWNLRETWLAPGIPSFLDGMLAYGVVGVLLLIGTGGTVAEREVTSEAALVPEYLRQREREARDRRELEIARTVQTRFLPRRMPHLTGLDVAATCVPALEVGGDLYDFIALDDGRVAIAIGDVSGKGIQAAFVMTLVKGFVQSLGREHTSPRALLSRLNTLFRANVPRGAFITLIYGLLDPAARTFTFSRAGHTPLVVRSRDGRTRLVQPPGAAIGLAPEAIFAAALAEETLHLAEGDTLVFYTDGFSEAMNPHHDLYGDERLCRTIAGLDPETSRGLIDALVDDVRAFAGEAEQHDDMTAIVLRVTGDPDAA